MKQLVVGTQSKFRLDLLSKEKIKHISASANIDEQFPSRPKNPNNLVSILSQLKAENISSQMVSDEKIDDSIILGLDSVAYFDGKILEKPDNRGDAIQRLTSMSNKSHLTYTGVFYINKDKAFCEVVKNKIYLKKIDICSAEKHIDMYQNAMDCALGYVPEKSDFIEKIEGDVNNFFYGLPLNNIKKTLANQFNHYL